MQKELLNKDEKKGLWTRPAMGMVFWFPLFNNLFLWTCKSASLYLESTNVMVFYKTQNEIVYEFNLSLNLQEEILLTVKQVTHFCTFLHIPFSVIFLPLMSSTILWYCFKNKASNSSDKIHFPDFKAQRGIWKKPQKTKLVFCF